jgi:hypothetical protein
MSVTTEQNVLLRPNFLLPYQLLEVEQKNKLNGEMKHSFRMKKHNVYTNNRSGARKTT